MDVGKSLFQNKTIFTEIKLHKIGITENALCKVCNEKNEGKLHIYIM